MGADLGYAVLIGFGSMKLTEIYKEVTRRVGLHHMAWWKSLVNLFLCGALTLLVMHRNVETKVLIGVAAAGLAALLHAVDTVLRSHRDGNIAEVMNRTSGRRR
jgi:hypothetical protein